MWIRDQQTIYSNERKIMLENNWEKKCDVSAVFVGAEKAKTTINKNGKPFYFSIQTRSIYTTNMTPLDMSTDAVLRLYIGLLSSTYIRTNAAICWNVSPSKWRLGKRENVRIPAYKGDILTLLMFSFTLLGY